MKKIEMIKGAKKLVDDCIKVKEEENVLIITDTNMPFSISETLAIACRERGAEAVITIMNPMRVEGNDPPPPIGEAMQKAQVIFQVLSRGIFHSPSTRKAAKAGARGMTIAEFTEEDMFRGAIEADFLETKELVERVGDALRKSKEARITTPAGTDINLDLSWDGERRVVTFTNICHQPGTFGIMILEASISPKVGTAQGTLVCDAAVTLLKPGLVREPIRALIKDGIVKEISGGPEARKLIELLEALDDPMVYNVAELGIGLNPNAIMTGAQTQYKGVYGTCHIGAGSNITWGGNIKASTHFDFVMYSPKIVLDGTTLLENYKFSL
jgi:leucyl aminopeptidase (aminopeptidase T)